MHTSMMMAVNSPPVAHRDITAPVYRINPDASIQRVDRPEPEPEPERKKDKKWSLGKLFRRKKKEDDTSSSESEGISARSPTKRKAKKKKRVPSVNNFDHIVIRDTRRAQSLAKPAIRDIVDEGVLSDPSAGFINYRAKTFDPYGVSKESLNFRDDNHYKSSRVSETPTRKTRKGRLKARVEALRNSLKGDSSSDEESLKSSNSSSMVRFRSDDSLMRSRDSSLNKRSRSARNERYIKRLSRDEENQLNKEAELLQQGYSKAEVEMLTRTPTSQSSGYGTCKKEQANNAKPEQIYVNDPLRRPLKSESISSFPSTQSYPSSINFNAKVNNEHINYSLPFQNGLNREPIYANDNRERSVNNHYPTADNVMYVKFPLGNVTNIRREEKTAPAPPPRDMQRKVATPISMYYETNPIVADRMGSNQNVMRGVPNNDFERVMRRSQDRTMSHGVNGLRRPISNSEDHIALQNNERVPNFQYKQPRRPASVSAEPNNYGMYVNTPPWRKKHEQLNNVIKPEPVKQDYLYFADQSPRSRKPISIKTSQNGYENYLSDSQASINSPENVYRRPRNASDFWKKLDDEERQRKQQQMYATSRSNSNTQLYRNPPYLENKSRLQRAESADIQNKNRAPYFSSQSLDTTDGAKMWKATTEYRRAMTVEPPKPQNAIISPTSKTHVRHKSDTFIPNTYQMPSDEEKNSERRKSTNLDDALNELEAIYNSLGLGDEDLLDRAEQRELMTPKFNDNYNDWNGNDERQLRSQPTTPLRRVPRRSTLPDKLQDDMAFRRMNSLPKEKVNGKDSQAQISYMLASPVYVPYASDDDTHSLRNEPDIVHDDVVYRNITQTKNRLKTLDPQPPFGIPVGPVSPAPQSDYLHATPENKARSRFVSRRSPDLVSDDLAYRNLRKDNRHSSVYNGEEYNGHINNNHGYSEYPVNKESTSNLKKKRAGRSLSANIFTMIQKEIDDALNMSKQATIQKTQSNSDVMKRLRETFEKNDNEPDYYPRNKVKQRHNTVSLFVNNTHTPAHHFAKDDSFIHNDDKYLSKPPSHDKSKSSSPSNRSPQASKRSSKDEFQQVLSLLAQEAMDTSNKLGVALAELDKNRNNNDKKADVQSRISDSRQNFLNGLTNDSHDDIRTEVKHVKVHGEIISGPSVESSERDNNNKSKAKKTEDSLLVISDQLHKVEDQLKHSIEKESEFDDESLKLSNYITETEEQLKAQECKIADNKLVPDIIPVTVQNDSIFINNSEVGKERANKIRPPSPKYNSLNPFLNCDDKVEDIGEMKGFSELKDGISDLIAGITQVNDKLFVPKPINLQEATAGKVTGISEASEKLVQAQSACKEKQEAPCRASVNLSIYEDDLEIKKEATDSTEYNSSEELASIFRLDGNKRPAVPENLDESGVRDDLSSPKLVKSMNQQLRRLSVEPADDCTPSQSSLPTNVVPWRTKRQNQSQQESRDDNPQSKRDWHENGTLMLACYTLMVSQHLADLDWLMLLGLLLAMVTIVAMLII